MNRYFRWELQKVLAFILRQCRNVLCFSVTLLITFAIAGFPSGADAAKQGINNTKHNLSVTGPGEIKALTETRICIFCHTPHNAEPRTPLWNKSLAAVSYILYSSTTMVAAPSQPAGPSRLCLSCHDGTIALGSVLQPAGGIRVTGQITPGRPSFIGTGLSGDHPVSFSYYVSRTNPEIVSDLPVDLVFYGSGNLECPTCHDAHDNAYGKFLVKDPKYSALCTDCHNISGWVGSIHSTSTAPVTGILPVTPRAWPTWSTVAEWGCENCHTPHSAQSQQWLLYYSTEAEVCNPCHGSFPGGAPHSARTASDVSPNIVSTNIVAQTEKISGHSIRENTVSYDPKRVSRSGPRHVSCGDCHNPHAASGGRLDTSVRQGRRGRISASLKGVTGIDRDGAEIVTATYEYEICFKCHSDYAPQIPSVQRVISSTNTRLQFQTSNPSYHPVEGQGKNPRVPSIPSTLEPTLSVSNIIYCTDCHRDDTGGSRGPHGSSFAPILRERYETADGIHESFSTYALCYRCHNRTSILNDDSFKRNITTNKGGHSGHLAAGASCAACHDAHGIADDSGFTGNHTHLINFDARIVSPKPGNMSPTFSDRGVFSGSCTLVCHGKVHDNLSYP